MIMALANDMSLLLTKIEQNLGLVAISHKLPKEFSKEAWASIIKNTSMVTFSRYFKRKIRFVINNETTIKKKEGGRWVYYIKEEYLGGQKLLGAMDIDWQDYSQENRFVNQSPGAGYGYTVPTYGGLDQTFESYLRAQMCADVNSLYNNEIFVNFEYPNKIILSSVGGATINVPSYVVILLVQHSDLCTISPTMMETFEQLAQADVANFLYMNLRYFEGLETIFINVDLKLSELDQERSKRPEIVEELKNAYVTAANDSIPYMMTVSGG